MNRILIVILMLVVSGAIEAERWKAVAWTFKFYQCETNDCSDQKKKEEVEYPTEDQCLVHLRSMTNTMISVGLEIRSELMKFGPEQFGEPFWRVQLQHPDNSLRLSFLCVRTVLFTIVPEEI